jgi:hypothetical protein
LPISPFVSALRHQPLKRRKENRPPPKGREKIEPLTHNLQLHRLAIKLYGSYFLEARRDRLSVTLLPQNASPKTTNAACEDIRSEGKKKLTKSTPMVEM